MNSENSRTPNSGKMNTEESNNKHRMDLYGVWGQSPQRVPEAGAKGKFGAKSPLPPDEDKRFSVFKRPKKR